MSSSLTTAWEAETAASAPEMEKLSPEKHRDLLSATQLVSMPQIVVIGPPPTFKNLYVVNGTRFV